METRLFGFEASHEGDSGRSLLVLAQDDLGHNLIQFQVEMIVNNKIPGLINLDCWEKDAEVKLYYNVTGLINLLSYLKRQKITSLHFLTLLDRIVSDLLESENYFLNPQSFVLDENYIYIDPNTLQVYMVYLPVEIKQNVKKTLDGLVSRLLSKAILEEPEVLSRQLQDFLLKPGFNLSDFGRYLKDLKRKYSGFGNSSPFEIIDDQPEKMQVWDSEVDSHKVTIIEALKNKLSLRLVLLIVLAIVSIFVVKTHNGDFLLLFVVGVGLIGILGGLYYTKTKSLVKPSDKLTHKLSDSLLDSQFEIAASQVVFGPDETVLLASNPEETVLLKRINCPVLQAINGDEKVIINKSELIIGRNKETCDYVLENKSIGRAHALITQLNGTYFLVDLDSKNGTFINGSQLVSNKRYELKANDRVSFAEVEYIFQLLSR